MSKETTITLDPPKTTFRKSLFADEAPEGTYHNSFAFEEYRVYVREMSPDELNAYMNSEQQLASRMDALKKKSENKPSDAVKLQIKTEINAVLDEQQTLAVNLIAGAIVGWDVPRPFSAQAVKNLTMTARNKLLKLVMRTAGLGQDEEDFLADNS